MSQSIYVTQRLEQALPQEWLTWLRKAGEVAIKQQQSLYLVGGVVRDLLLGRPNFDLDLVVEGDAPTLARQLASPEQVVVHPRFGTAKLCLGNLSLDLVTARAETYPHPGALPIVKPGSIQDDLFRRDFSINAMAIRLSPSGFGELVDPYGGKQDLERGLLRVLHENSFIDDATRILRGLRYEQRLGFHLEPVTKRLLHRDLAMLKTISGDRIRHELELILKEDCPEKILRRAEELGVLKEIHLCLRGNHWLEEKFQQARLHGASLALYFSLLAYNFTEQDSQEFLQRLKMPGAVARAIRDTLHLKEEVKALATPELQPSAIYRLLEGYSPQAILALALASDSPLVAERLHLYLNKLRYVKISLDGEALKRMGIPPGPQLGEIIRALKDARLDGKVKTRKEEEELVRKWLSGQLHR